MDVKHDMSKIKNHFDKMNEEEFEKKLREHGMEEIKSMNYLGMSLTQELEH